MEPFKTIIGLTRWISENLAYNLDHVPDDKLHWKPEPTALSAATVVVHVTYSVINLHATLEGREYTKVEFEEVSASQTREELKKNLLDATTAFISTLEGYGPQDLEGDVQMPWGPFPRARCITTPMVELIHHHGQIAYLQTLWGDTESHFKEMGS